MLGRKRNIFAPDLIAICFWGRLSPFLMRESTVPEVEPSAEWGLIGRAIADELPRFQNARVWIPQPEDNPAFFAALQGLNRNNIEVFQTFRPAIEALKRHRLKAQQTLPEGPLDLVLCVPTRQRAESLALIAHGLLNLSPDGALAFACHNTQGAGGFLSKLKEVVPGLEAESGKKCRWVLIQAAQIQNRAVLLEWVKAAAPVLVPGTQFHSVPGIYGWNKVDRGSELLVSTLPPLTGSGADIGCGYGYLTHEVLTRSPEVAHVVLVEADARALDCARQNLAPFGKRCHFHWLDATLPEGHTVLQNLDWVVMNPPFHENAETNHGIGRAFIETAAAALVSGGQLFLVANHFLGYEKLLSVRFGQVQRVLDKDGFKVIHARR